MTTSMSMFTPNEVRTHASWLEGFGATFVARGRSSSALHLRLTGGADLGPSFWPQFDVFEHAQARIRVVGKFGGIGKFGLWWEKQWPC